MEQTPPAPLVEFVLFAIRDFSYRTRLQPEMVRMHEDDYEVFANEIVRRMEVLPEPILAAMSEGPPEGIKIEGSPVMASGEVEPGDVIVSHIARIDGPETYTIRRES